MLHSIDRQKNIVSVSYYWLEKLGYQRQEMINQSLMCFVAEGSKQKVEQPFSTLAVRTFARRGNARAYQRRAAFD